MPLVRHPVTVETPDQLLAEARRLIDAETDHLGRTGVVSCGPQCNACCNHSVPVTPAEVRAILGAVALLPSAVRSHIAARARHVVARVDREVTPSLDPVTATVAPPLLRADANRVRCSSTAPVSSGPSVRSRAATTS